MIFEGTEKKVEIIVSNRGKSLRDYGLDFWANIVKNARAFVLSTSSNGKIQAYLLSESSLFIMDDRMIMITCGKTNLAHATGTFIDEVGASNIRYLVYERKNENFPHLQPTSFEDDIGEIERRIKGHSAYFGEKNEHYLSLFASDKPFTPPPNDTTIEILMYDIAPEVRQTFRGQDFPRPQLLKTFPGYVIDDHVFSPCGYSLNAIREACYYTIHVTPEEHGSYASFESNVCIGTIDTEKLVQSVVGRFLPDRFDVIIFDNPGASGTSVDMPGYSVLIKDRQDIGTSYNVQFQHFRKMV